MREKGTTLAIEWRFKFSHRTQKPRTQPGVAGVPGTPGEFTWSGAQGTMFWVDPKEEMVVVFLANTPDPIRRHYREPVKTLVVQAIAD